MGRLLILQPPVPHTVRLSLLQAQIPKPSSPGAPPTWLRSPSGQAAVTSRPLHTLFRGGTGLEPRALHTQWGCVSPSPPPAGPADAPLWEGLHLLSRHSPEGSMTGDLPVGQGLQGGVHVAGVAEVLHAREAWEATDGEVTAMSSVVTSRASLGWAALCPPGPRPHLPSPGT